MSEVFADTQYWIAIINPHDQWHQRAVAVSQTLGTVQLVTTDDMLVEVLNFFAGYGAQMRQTAAQTVRSILQACQIPHVRRNRNLDVGSTAQVMEGSHDGYTPLSNTPNEARALCEPFRKTSPLPRSLNPVANSTPAASYGHDGYSPPALVFGPVF